MDLLYLLIHGTRFLRGGSRELLDLSTGELSAIIEKMITVNAVGDRLIHRILNEKHRFFDPSPLGEWHRSQVRRDVARAMHLDLNDETAIYGGIASAFPPVHGCDSIRCKVRRLP